MSKNSMDKAGQTIIKICVFSIILSLTALVLCAIFQNWTKETNTKPINKKDTIIVIDAGHGGEDGGALSADGVQEKDLNLSIALTLGEMLKSSGYNVVYTRTEDKLLYTEYKKGSLKMQDLKNRLNIANSAENTVFISIHMNKFTQEKYSGLQVFYSPNDSTSSELANLIQDNVKNKLQPNNDRKTKMAGSNIYLLDNINTPAVLIECGFLSNSDECSKLKNETYQKELSSVIYSSVVEFLSCS